MKEKLFSLFLVVMAGLVWWFRKYSNDWSLRILEQEARITRRGIGSDEDPVAPWDFRRAKCSKHAW